MRYNTIKPWKNIKSVLGKKSQSELLSLLHDCYKTSDEAKLVLTASAAESQEDFQAIVDDLRRLLKESFWIRDNKGEVLCPNLKDARKIIMYVHRLTKDADTYISFLLDYVEHGMDLSDFNDGQSYGFYTSMENTFYKVTRLIVKNKDAHDMTPHVIRVRIMGQRTLASEWGFDETIEWMFEEFCEGIGLCVPPKMSTDIAYE